MTTTDLPTAELVSLPALQELIKSPGPCITIFLPAYHPGQAAGTPVSFLKSDLREIEQRLLEADFSEEETNDILDPLYLLESDPDVFSGSQWGHAILRSPKVFKHFHLTQPVEPNVMLAGCFAVRELASELELPSEFYVLTISQKKVGLIRCAGHQAEEVPLPSGIPETFADAMKFERPDHNLANRSASGHNTGTMVAVRFGTGTEREKESDHLLDYYRAVDRGITSSFLRKTSLILAGVQVDTDRFKAVSSNALLLSECIPGSKDVPHPHELLKPAYAILHRAHENREIATLKHDENRNGWARFSTHLENILKAAVEGRVQEVYLDSAKQSAGIVEADGYRSFGAEDLLNFAAVQTMLHRGQLHEIPSAEMPLDAMALAIFRY